MGMNSDYLAKIGDMAEALLTHIGLVNGDGIELSVTGSHNYIRQPVTWTQAPDGTIRPSEDIEFAISEGDTIAGWRAYDGATGEAVEYGGADLSAVTFPIDGFYRLVKEGTGIIHQVPTVE